MTLCKWQAEWRSDFYSFIHSHVTSNNSYALVRKTKDVFLAHCRIKWMNKRFFTRSFLSILVPLDRMDFLAEKAHMVVAGWWYSVTLKMAINEKVLMQKKVIARSWIKHKVSSRTQTEISVLGDLTFSLAYALVSSLVQWIFSKNCTSTDHKNLTFILFFAKKKYKTKHIKLFICRWFFTFGFRRKI